MKLYPFRTNMHTLLCLLIKSPYVFQFCETDIVKRQIFIKELEPKNLWLQLSIKFRYRNMWRRQQEIKQKYDLFYVFCTLYRKERIPYRPALSVCLSVASVSRRDRAAICRYLTNYTLCKIVTRERLIGFSRNLLEGCPNSYSFLPYNREYHRWGCSKSWGGKMKLRHYATIHNPLWQLMTLPVRTDYVIMTNWEYWRRHCSWWRHHLWCHHAWWLSPVRV